MKRLHDYATPREYLWEEHHAGTIGEAIARSLDLERRRDELTKQMEDVDKATIAIWPWPKESWRQE